MRIRIVVARPPAAGRPATPARPSSRYCLPICSTISRPRDRRGRHQPAEIDQRQAAPRAGVALGVAAEQRPTRRNRPPASAGRLAEQRLQPRQRLGVVPEQLQSPGRPAGRGAAACAASGRPATGVALSGSRACNQQVANSSDSSGSKLAGRPGSRQPLKTQRRRHRPTAGQLEAPGQHRRLVAGPRVREAANHIGQLVDIARGQGCVQQGPGLGPKLQFVRLAACRAAGEPSSRWNSAFSRLSAWWASSSSGGRK